MDLDRIFEEVSKQMRSDFVKAQGSLNHPGLKGQANEETVRQFLGQYLPKSLDIANGTRTYHLAANAYRTFGERAGYVRTRGFEPIQQQEMVIQYLRAHKRSEVTELCKISPDQAKRLLRKLVKAGKLLQHGKGKGTRYELNPLNTGEPK